RFRTKRVVFLQITMHLIGVVLILVVTGIAKGWECSAGCSTETGFCEKPGKCRCKPGWEGENCDRCIPFPGCLHGRCEKAWQCICREGWVGSLCDQDTRQCSSKPCTSNATCIEKGEGGYLCVCPQGYTGENCLMKQGVCFQNGYQYLFFYISKNLNIVSLHQSTLFQDSSSLCNSMYCTDICSH
ncbi:hypothetical protein CHARACLAT_025754, partial [Characodon lateralis]|nr:hypothetical protein [Characodon lateralis]